MSNTSLMTLFAKLAKKADLVTVDSGAYCQFSRDVIRNNNHNALFSVKWVDESQEFRCTITERAFELKNQPSFDSGTGIFRLIDSEGDPTTVRFYRLELLKG